MSKLPVFIFERQQVRLFETADQPEWIPSDVGNILEIKNVCQQYHIAHISGGEQSVFTVTEPGLYRLIFNSRNRITLDQNPTPIWRLW